MATLKLTHQTYNNFSGGYACEQAYINEKMVSFIGDSKNIDIYATESNNGYGFKKCLGNRTYLQIQGEKIKNLFSYNYSKDGHYLIVHTVDDTEGKLYYINQANTPVLLKSGLDKDAIECSFVNFSQTLPNKRYLGLFCNGVDPIIKIELGANPEIEEIDEQDSEGRDVRGTTLEAYYGRVWCGVDDRIHWSKSLDPFTWSTTEDDAGWAQLDSDIIAITTYAGGLLISTKKSIYYCQKDTSNTGFIFSVLSPNYSISSRGLIKHDNYALYMANDGIYPVNVTQEDTKRVEEDITGLIQNWLIRRDIFKECENFALSVTSNEHNEVWFQIPIRDMPNNSVIFIYRFITGRQKHYYWLPPRVQQKINCLIEFDNLILSGTDDGKILQELMGDTFDGANIESIAEFPELDFNGTYNKQKYKLFIYTEVNDKNNFYVDYFFDGETDYDRQEVICENSSSKWGVAKWGVDLWSSVIMLQYMLDKPRKHNRLKLRFVAENSNQQFRINKFETSKIKVKNK